VAKKIVHRTTALTTAQNVLMRKLGIFGESQLEASNFERYLKLFNEGLTEEQVKLIKELFMDRLLTTEDDAVALENT
jgi:hypothetical protein